MRIWVGKFILKNKKGRNIGIHVYEHENIDYRNVVKTIVNALENEFPKEELIISPSAKTATAK